VLRVKVALTVVLALTVKAQPAVPLQPAPLQPVKVEPVLAVAPRAMLVPLAMLALQVLPQSMAGGLGLEVTVPLPVLPVLVTVTV
jgi:hypothetical protein